ncbi:hypothetical protein BV898_10354 [Hypsibius exemplaris]|uniref:Chromo domain-containing protein n=1 Tax=Hypsibius exemplaris TaxID=2072580 RepID=A0A1W0WJU7_HYPEX|nr:hypothetical protein BV898_10354 [Hypsibius exemplaris]
MALQYLASDAGYGYSSAKEKVAFLAKLSMSPIPNAKRKFARQFSTVKDRDHELDQDNISLSGVSTHAPSHFGKKSPRCAGAGAAGGSKDAPFLPPAICKHRRLSPSPKNFLRSHPEPEPGVITRITDEDSPFPETAATRTSKCPVPRVKSKTQQQKDHILEEVAEPVYEVECILDKIGQGPTARYLIKWLGYDEETWEPAADLGSCKDLVRDFEKALEETKTRAKKTRNHSKVAPPSAITNGKQVVNFRPSGSLLRVVLTEDRSPSPELRLPSTSTVQIRPKAARMKSLGSEPSTSRSTVSAIPQQKTLFEETRAAPRHRSQTTFTVAAIGTSGVEKHFHIELIIRSLEDCDFLVNYAGETPSEYVSYEVCIKEIPTFVADYLAHIPALL